MMENKENFYSVDTERNTVNKQRRKQVVAAIPLTIQRNLLSVYFKYCYFALLATLSIIRAQITTTLRSNSNEDYFAPSAITGCHFFSGFKRLALLQKIVTYGNATGYFPLKSDCTQAV